MVSPSPEIYDPEGFCDLLVLPFARLSFGVTAAEFTGSFSDDPA
jgi:hypothetical protein